MFRRIGIALGAAAVSLAFAASAQAAPTTPIMKPIPFYTCGTPTVSWTPSSPDPGGTIISYRIDIGDLTTGTATAKYVGGLSTTLPGLTNNHHYVVRVRALQLRYGALSYSLSSGRTFKKTCLQISQEILNRYVAYNPFPECIMCGRFEDIYQGDDPVIYKQLSVATLPAAERFKGIELEADGSVLFG
jgi:Fibronectin type III domain